MRTRTPEQKLERNRKEREKRFIARGGYSGYRKTNCVVCGSVFQPSTSHGCFCGPECRLVGVRKTKNKESKKYYHRKKKDPNFKMARKLLTSLGKVLFVSENRKIHGATYTYSELRSHFERLFKEGMTWENHGKWHIDHIKPLSSFRFFDEYGNPDESQIKEANSLDNLQPLWAEDNLSKHNR